VVTITTMGTNRGLGTWWATPIKPRQKAGTPRPHSTTSSIGWSFDSPGWRFPATRGYMTSLHDPSN
jgi:hypothetical protein